MATSGLMPTTQALRIVQDFVTPESVAKFGSSLHAISSLGTIANCMTRSGSVLPWQAMCQVVGIPAASRHAFAIKLPAAINVGIQCEPGNLDSELSCNVLRDGFLHPHSFQTTP